MTNPMPGNPYYDLAGESIRASWPKTDTAPLHLQSAQVEATLTLAFEQRTATLVNVVRMYADLGMAEQAAGIIDAITDRLGGYGGDDA